MSKKTITLCVALILALTLGLGGTLAYLTDTDADKNVMTVGRVQIVQNEQQRVEDEENGVFTDKLEPFENDKMLLPVTGRDDTPDDVTVGKHELTLKDTYNNYIDKIVSATNTGNTDAWVRTLVAIPTGDTGDDYWHNYDASADMWLHWNLIAGVYDHYTVNEITGKGEGEIAYITVDGVEYEVWEFIHNEPVTPGETTFPVMRGLFLDERVDMDEDGYYIVLNGEEVRIGNFLDSDGKLNVLVLTQAVQADGFATAEDAFNKAFPTGEDNTTIQNWFTGWDDEDIGSPGDKWPNNNVPNYLYNGPDINDSSIKKGSFVLGNDIKTSDYGSEARYGYGYEYIVRNGVDYTLDLNGKTIVHDTVNANANHNAFTYLFVANNAGTKLTIEGEGKIKSNNSEGYTCAVQGKTDTLITVNGGDFEVDNGIAVWAGAGAHIVINGGSFVNGNATSSHELIYSSGGVIDIYGGFFHNTDGNYTLNVEDRNRSTGFINVYGGTYVNFDPSTGGQDPNNIKVADGYKVVSETQDNGDIWYTVVKE